MLQHAPPVPIVKPPIKPWMDYCIHCPFHIDLGHIKHTTLFWTILTAVDCFSKAAHFVPLSKLPTVHPWRLLNSYWTMLLGFMGFLSTLCQTMGLSSSTKYGKLFVNPWELMLVCLLVTTHSRGGFGNLPVLCHRKECHHLIITSGMGQICIQQSHQFIHWRLFA